LAQFQCLESNENSLLDKALDIAESYEGFQLDKSWTIMKLKMLKAKTMRKQAETTMCDEWYTNLLEHCKLIKDNNVCGQMLLDYARFLIDQVVAEKKRIQSRLMKAFDLIEQCIKKVQSSSAEYGQALVIGSKILALFLAYQKKTLETVEDVIESFVQGEEEEPAITNSWVTFESKMESFKQLLQGFLANSNMEKNKFHLTIFRNLFDAPISDSKRFAMSKKMVTDYLYLSMSYCEADAMQDCAKLLWQSAHQDADGTEVFKYVYNYHVYYYLFII
jgi:hypothetical protein